jgi:hypothetical protein
MLNGLEGAKKRTIRTHAEVAVVWCGVVYMNVNATVMYVQCTKAQVSTA